MKDDTPLHLQNVLKTPTREVTNSDEEAGLPSLLESEYQPHARPTHKAVHALHFVFPSGEVKTVQYVHLDSQSQFANNTIELRFIGYKVAHVKIQGRNLWRLYDYIHQHRMPWIMQATRDFGKDRDIIISKITIMEPEPLNPKA